MDDPPPPYSPPSPLHQLNLDLSLVDVKRPLDFDEDCSESDSYSYIRAPHTESNRSVSSQSLLKAPLLSDLEKRPNACLAIS